MALTPAPLPQRERGPRLDGEYLSEVSHWSRFVINRDEPGRDAGESDPTFFEQVLAFGIFRTLFGSEMDVAIDLDCNPEQFAVEVQHDPPNRMLSPELQIHASPISQRVPEKCLACRWVPS